MVGIVGVTAAQACVISVPGDGNAGLSGRGLWPEPTMGPDPGLAPLEAEAHLSECLGEPRNAGLVAAGMVQNWTRLHISRSSGPDQGGERCFGGRDRGCDR